MPFQLVFTQQADEDLREIEEDSSRAGLLKQTRKILGYLEQNPRHPSLNTHRHRSFAGPNGERIWQSYAQNHTPGAHRVFWYYGPERRTITVVSIQPHPD